MKREDHVGRLFSAAYDRELDGEEMEDFQGHLAHCASCASDFRRYSERIDSVRALPRAQMPVSVHLPIGAPGAEAGDLLARLLERISRPRLSTGWVTGVAAAATAALVIGVALLHGGGGTSTGSSKPAAAPPIAAAAPRAADEAGRPPCGSGIPVPQAALRDVGALYPNRAMVSAPGSPGRTLTIGTAAEHVAAGARIPVFAELATEPPAAGSAATGGGQVTYVVAPCVTLSRAPSAAAGALAPSGAQPGEAIRAPAPQAAAPRPPFGAQPLAIGTVAGGQPQGEGPVQEITIPPGLAPGTVLHLTAVVPGGGSRPGDPPLTAELTIIVG